MKPTAESIWNEFSAGLGRFIRARIADAATAEDIQQDVFLKFQSRLEEFQDPAKIQGWLFLVARNAIIDHYRTRKPTSELPEMLSCEGAESAIEVEEVKAVFRRIIDSLPEPYREALVLTEFEGLTQRQLARQQGISLSGAKSRVQRGRERLKERLLDYCHHQLGQAADGQVCPHGLLPEISMEGSDRRGRRRRDRADEKRK